MIKKYGVIDHVGSLTKDEVKAVYNRVYDIAINEDGYEKDKTVITLKQLCVKQYNPYSRKKLESERLTRMKQAMRHQKKPSQVYFICPSLYKNVEREVRKWFERGIPVEIYEAKSDRRPEISYIYRKDREPEKVVQEPSDKPYQYEKFFMTASTDPEWEDFDATHQLSWGADSGKLRKLVAEWAPAFDISFSAPVLRYDKYGKVIIPDNYLKRPDHDEMVASGETHFSKPLTSSKKFLEHNRCVATNAEVKRAWEQIVAYVKFAGGSIVTEYGPDFGAFKGDKAEMNKWLYNDYIICEECGHPMRIHFEENKCLNCGWKYEDEAVFSIYYEDAYFDDADTYLDDDYESSEYDEDQYWKELEAESEF